MSRKLIGALTAAVALNAVVVGSTLLWPNTARSTGGQTSNVQASAHVAIAKADVDPVCASATSEPRRESIPTFLAMIDFERVLSQQVLASAPAMLRRESVPVVSTTIDFERVFASVSEASRDNTPPTREKLRNAGWKRLLGSS